MSANSPEMLLGRLAVHYKMVTMEQLSALTKLQARTGGAKKLGELLVDEGLISAAQLDQLIKVQREYVAKQQARGQTPAEAGSNAPRAAPQAAGAPSGARASRVNSIEIGRIAKSGSDAPRPKSRVESTSIGRDAASAESVIERPIGGHVESSRPAEAATPQSGRVGARVSELQIGRDRATEAKSGGAAQPGAGGHIAGPKQVDPYLRSAVGLGASDIHFHCGCPVRQRVNGVLGDTDSGVLSGEKTRAMAFELLTATEAKALEEHGQIDFAYAIDGLARFRCNAYRQQKGYDLIMRAVSATPPSLEELGLPGSLAKYTNFHQGMVLVTGPAGCGKSSTMAALLNIINEERLDHIITVEDPIEFVHENKRCVVNQRQVGPHTKSFARALKGALREDPDIIALGELRDLETISLALTAAETGHLVIATLHTGNSIRTINRLVGVFPPNQQAQIRTMVSESLRAVISQRLVPKADGRGRVPALEILVNTKAVGSIIRDNKTFQLRSALQTGVAHGMKLLDVSLTELVKSGAVAREDALKVAEDPQKFPA